MYHTSRALGDKDYNITTPAIEYVLSHSMDEHYAMHMQRASNTGAWLVYIGVVNVEHARARCRKSFNHRAGHAHARCSLAHIESLYHR